MVMGLLLGAQLRFRGEGTTTVRKDMEWEVIEVKDQYEIRRHRTPMGWLVRIGPHGLAYVPDEGHRWEPCK